MNAATMHDIIHEVSLTALRAILIALNVGLFRRHAGVITRDQASTKVRNRHDMPLAGLALVRNGTSG